MSQENPSSKSSSWSSWSNVASKGLIAKRNSLLIAVSLTFITSACLPIPHLETQSPTLEGTVRRNGVPLENVQVFDNQDCVGSKIVSTNKEGQFRVSSTRSFQLFVPVVGDYGHGSSICFKMPDGRQAAWNAFRLGSSPEFQRLECEVNSSSAQFNQPIALESLKGKVDRARGANFCSVVEER